MEMRKRFNLKNFKVIDIPFKETVEKVKKFIDQWEKPRQLDKRVDSQGRAVAESFGYSGSLDEFGREVPDPRPRVVHAKVLSKEQKIFNQFVAAHNKAVLEKENLPWDMSTPEAAKKSMEEILNLDMPDETPEFFSQYEYLPMAEEWPEVPNPPEPEEPQPDPIPAPTPAPAPVNENG